MGYFNVLHIMTSKSIALVVILMLSTTIGLSTTNYASAETDSNSETNNSPTQEVGDCDPDVERPLEVQQASYLPPGKFQAEPAVVFIDETFTFTYHSQSGEGPWGHSQPKIHNGWFQIDNQSGEIDLYDDGTHGDAVSGDNVWTRSCIHFSQNSLVSGDKYTERGHVIGLDPNLRGSVTSQIESDTIRTTEGGYFINIGESYGERWENSWGLVSPSFCAACYDAWNVSGHVFDFIVINSRDYVGGAGYIRNHDPVGNIGINTPCVYNSHCYTSIDGLEHPEFRGIISMMETRNYGLTHEMGHGFMGLETRDFPEEGEGAWNEGDGAHLDSDTTVRGDISGPFWDPNRGWPYAVQIEDEDGQRTEVRLIHDNGSFQIIPDSNERHIWSDIFLYMSGFLSAENATEVNYKLVNESIEGCTEEEYALFCTETNVTAERVIEFDTQDFIDRYGERIPAHDGDESQINLGVLHISDRNHTEAEMIWFTEEYKEWAYSSEPEPSNWNFTTSDPWNFATRGLSSVTIDPALMTERPLANTTLLSSNGEPNPWPEPDNCKKQFEIDNPENLTSTDVCAIYVDKVYAIDAIRFVYSDGSYIDTGGSAIGDGRAHIQWILPENQSIVKVDYSIHNRISWSPYDEVDGIISSITIHTQGRDNLTSIKNFDTLTYDYWSPEHTHEGESVIETGSFSEVGQLIYYVQFERDDCWSCNDVTDVFYHTLDEDGDGIYDYDEVSGCTDSVANNYLSFATDDDGSCDYDLDNDGVNDIDEVLGCTNYTANNYASLATDDDGSCDYDLDNDGINDIDEVSGCVDSRAYNYDPFATDDDGSCDYDTDGDGISDFDEVSGCKDSTANNYDPLATDDDGSCDYDLDNDGVNDIDEISGCTDIYANNHDNIATDDDGSCDYDLDDDGVNDDEEVLGCTDSSANNYDPLATDDHGMCIYDLDNEVNQPDVISGCTDSSANNYDPLATDDDGSCDYTEIIESKEGLPGFGTLMATSMLLLASMISRRKVKL